MSSSFNCPSCGAQNTFKSADSLFAVCPYCRASVFKSEDQIELLGKVSEIPDDNSPLQIGSQGQYEGRLFTVIGRVRMKWEDGFWNEWHLLMSDGKSAWMSEAQGEFALLYEYKLPDEKLRTSKWFVNDEVKIDGQSFFIADLKEAEVFLAEGELPFRAEPGELLRSADLRLKVGNLFASLEQGESNDEVRVYAGKLVELSQLKMNYLRKFDGW